MGVSGQRHAPAALAPEKHPVPIVQEVGWAPGPVWTGAEKLASIGIRSLDLLVRSEALYRLRYPGPRRSRVVPVLWHEMPVKNNSPKYIGR